METISLPSAILFNIGPIHVTNALLTAFVLTLVFFFVMLKAKRKYGLVPSRFQMVMELGIDYIWQNVKSAFKDEEKAKRFFPMLMTIFLFIIVANQLSLIPLVFNIVVGDVKVFRLPTSDLSMTFAFALFIVILSNALAFKMAPIQHLGKFINIKGFFKIKKPGDIGTAVLDLFFGVLDIISELAKVLSLSFRLFGNVFAGEVMVVVIAGLSAYTAYLVPIPFIVLSVFSGLIQALVFVFLSTQYMAITISDYEKEDEKLSSAQA